MAAFASHEGFEETCALVILKSMHALRTTTNKKYLPKFTFCNEYASRLEVILRFGLALKPFDKGLNLSKKCKFSENTNESSALFF